MFFSIKKSQIRKYNLGKPSEGKVAIVSKSLTEPSYENTYQDGVKATEGMRNIQRLDMQDFDPFDKHVQRAKTSTRVNLGRKAGKLIDEAWKENGSFVASVRHVKTDKVPLMSIAILTLRPLVTVLRKS